MKNPKVGEEVQNKRGMHEIGVITFVFADGTVSVRWHLQDGFDYSDCVIPKTLRRVPKPPACPTCWRCGKVPPVYRDEGEYRRRLEEPTE